MLNILQIYLILRIISDLQIFLYLIRFFFPLANRILKFLKNIPLPIITLIKLKYQYLPRENIPGSKIKEEEEIKREYKDDDK